MNHPDCFCGTVYVYSETGCRLNSNGKGLKSVTTVSGEQCVMMRQLRVVLSFSRTFCVVYLGISLCLLVSLCGSYRRLSLQLS